MEEQSDTPRTDATQYQWTRTLELARDLERELATATRERDEARADLETERMRLTACGVVAMANTPESAARVRDILPEYFSASLHSVMGAVDCEMELRAEVERLRSALRSILGWRELRSGANEFPVDRIESIAKAALAAAEAKP